MDGSKNHERDLGSLETRYEVPSLGNLWPYWTRRSLVLLVAVLLVTSFLPGRAFAAGNYYPGQEVIVDGMVAGDGDVGYMCIAYTNFNAALVALGVSVSDSRLTDDARAKLSNASSGGDFFLFADSFRTRAQLNGNLPSWADDVMLQAFVSNWENIAGSGPIGPYQDIFYATVSPDVVDSAKRDLNTVLSGGDLGGGGSVPTDGYYTFNSNIYFYEWPYSSADYYLKDSSGVKYTNLYKYRGLDNTTYKLLPESVTLRIPEQTLSSLNSMFPYESNTWYVYIQIYAGKIDLNIVAGNVINPNVKTQTLSDEGKPTIVNEYISSLNYTYEDIYISHLPFSSDYTYDNGVITYTGTSELSASSWPNGNSFWNTFLGTFYLKKADVTPSVPPSNWPSEPETPAPTAPEVPEPSEPDLPMQPSTPTAPTLPDFPSNVIAPGTTYETFDIQAILDAMDEHCRHLQQAIYTGISDYFDTFTPWLSQELETVRACIRGESQWQMDVLHTELDDLQDYLWQLAQWLAVRMQFDVSGGGYDDSSVVAWLKRIYFKLGGGAVSTRPIDPVVDPGGISDWLDKLFQQLIDALFGVGANVLAQLLEKLQALEEKFPFCIPWDIGAILALMVATPEAPAFDLPCYSLTSEGVQQVGVYEIDLSLFDDYMGPIRSMQTILFAAFLCFKVDWFKSALKMEGLS